MNRIIFFILLLAPLLVQSEWRSRQRYELSFTSVYYPELTETGSGQSVDAPIRIWWDYRLKHEALSIELSPLLIFDPAEQDKSNASFLDLQDSFAEWSFGELALFAGSRIFAWSTVDLFSPLDVINSRRWVNPLQTTKLGAPSVGLSWSGPDFKLVLAGVISPRQPILPGEQSRWMPRRMDNLLDYIVAEQDGIDEVRLNDDPRYEMAPFGSLSDEPPLGGALRFQYFSNYGDWNLVALRSLSSVPVFEVKLDHIETIEVFPRKIVEIQNPIGLVPHTYQQQVLGFGWSYAFKYTILRFEFADRQPLGEHPLLPEREHAATGSIEYNWALLDRGVTSILQYSDARYPNEKDQPKFSQLMRVLSPSLNLVNLWTWSDDLSLQLFNFRNLRDQGSLSQVQVNYRFSDWIESSFGFTTVDGGKKSALSLYSTHNSVFLSLKYSGI